MRIVERIFDRATDELMDERTVCEFSIEPTRIIALSILNVYKTLVRNDLKVSYGLFVLDESNDYGTCETCGSTTEERY